MGKSTSRLGRGLGGLISGGGKSSDNASSSITELKISTNGPVASSPIDENYSNQESSGDVKEISLTQIVTNPYQPRKSIDPQTIEDLSASIVSEGLLQPIVVREVGEQFEIIAGERRWRAHQNLGRKMILARILKASDLSSASLSLIENLQREDLNPIEEAMGYHSLINEFNLTQVKVAERVGKSRVYVTNLLRLLKLHDELRSLLAEGKLSIGHAKVLLGVEVSDEQLKLGLRCVAEGWTVRHCEDEVNALLNPKSGNSSVFRKTNNPFAGIAQQAESVLGRSVRIKGNSQGGGKMTLSFKDQTDLQNLLSHLGL